MAKLKKALIIAVLFTLGASIHYFKKPDSKCAEEAEQVIEYVIQEQTGVTINFDDLPDLG